MDTDTGERLDAYLFVAVLPYSGYAYTEAFPDMKHEACIHRPCQRLPVFWRRYPHPHAR